MVQQYRECFNKMSDGQLIDAFNRGVGNNGWTNSRASYLSALHCEFKKRYDFSVIGDKGRFSLKNKVKLIGKKLSLMKNSK